MNYNQIVEQMLTFALQQHQAKDALIEELRKKIAEFETAKVAQNNTKPVKKETV